MALKVIRPRELVMAGKHNEPVYLKSEVDAVIAEKDAKILALDAEVFKQKHHAKLFLDERNYAETQLRHHKYKRCLDKAKWCKLWELYTMFHQHILVKFSKQWCSIAQS